MKTLLIMTILTTLVSCGKDESNEAQYRFPVNTINKNWIVVRETLPGLPKFTSIDLTNLNAITITNAERDGVKTNCVFSADDVVENGFYGSMDINHVSGDAFICSQFVGRLGYQAINNTRTGIETLNVYGKDLE
jgi:hypothetical protein